MNHNPSTEVVSTQPALTEASTYVRSGEKMQRGWAKLLDWEVRHMKIVLNLMAMRSRWSRRQVTAPKGPVVSLTTYGPRIHTVHLTIESIAAGTERPSRLILWLDEKEVLRNLPAPLRRLQDRGLEILETPNYGPYKKFYPYLESLDDFFAPLVTADDDLLYPTSWLHGLRKSFSAYPDAVNCYRAHEMKFVNGRLAPYVSWGRCRSNLPSFRHFATGVSGILYPPHFLRILKAAGRAFERVCPKNDDIWLHLNAVRSGYRIRQVRPWQMNYQELPNTQGIGLALTNVHSSLNDVTIGHVYNAHDLETVRSG